MRTGYRLLCAPRAATLEALSAAVDVEAVARALGSDTYTTRQRLVGTGVRALASGAERSAMVAMQTALGAAGLPSTIFEVERVRAPHRVRLVEARGDTLTLHAREGEPAVGEIRPGERWLGVPVSLPGAHEVLQGRPLAEDVPEEAALDLLNERGDWYRLRLHGFLFSRLEGGAGVASLSGQVGRLVKRLEACAPVAWHLGFPGNHGRALEADEAREYPLRAWAVWRAGLLAGEGTAATVAPLTRPAAPHGPSAIAPLRRRPVSLPRRARDAMRTPAAAFVAVWALAVVAALLLASDHRAMFKLALSLLLGGGGLVALGLGVRALWRWQHVADTPRSRVRSVAQGKAELAGAVAPEAPLHSPWARQPCVWYEVSVERRVRPLEMERLTPWVFVFLRGRASRALDREGWETVVEGDSGDLPFRLQDDTGAIRVDPTGATWVGCPAEVHHAEQAGDEWRVTERFLPVGARLYALGTVERAAAGATAPTAAHEALRALKADPVALARYDLDGNGRIDEEEWARARRAAVAEAQSRDAAEHTGTLPTLRKGSDGVLILSDRPERGVRRRLLRTAALATGLGLGLVALAVWVYPRWAP